MFLNEQIPQQAVIGRLLSMREDWIEVQLGNILNIARGGSPRPIKNYLTNRSDGINWIKIGDTKKTSKYITSTSEKIIPEGLSKTRLVKKGDFLLSNSMSFGRPYVLKISGAIHDGWLVLSNKPGIDITTDYLFYTLSSPISYNQFSKLATGSTVKNLNTGIVSKVKIPLAPLPEQRAIVAKIEQLFSELDNGIANLKAAKDKLEIYRQAVLKKAFEGELTREWREQQTDLPTADELLEQIKQARIKHRNKQLEEWKQAVEAWATSEKKGKKPAKPRKQKELPELSQEDLPTLPKSMAWVQLGDILWSVKDGPHYSPKYSESGIPFISGGNIRPHGIDFSNTKYISPELHQELSIRCKPDLNDILYTKGGTTGIARVNTYDIDFNVWVHVAVLKPIDPIVPFYLQHALNSRYCYKQSQKYTHGVGNQDLGLTRMVLITLPVCSVKEQTQIVQEIETRLSVCDNAIANIEEGLTKAEALRQSILKKAFAGKLLTGTELQACRNQPDWEPAAKLLERIKDDKKSTQKKKSKK
ncbi:MAG: restriction endonuclease subunit S [Candidatus Electrothrix sp. AR4]|nr:restriction endonuclease subunit S [Candidatus Electrothrix sp. AR4]